MYNIRNKRGDKALLSQAQTLVRSLSGDINGCRDGFVTTKYITYFRTQGSGKMPRTLTLNFGLYDVTIVLRYNLSFQSEIKDG